MFFGSNLVLILVVLGFLLTLVGFGLRSHNGGVLLIGVGLIVALGTLIYKGVETFG